MTILYFVAYSFCYMVSLLPFWVLYRISDLFYVLLYHIIKYKRKVVRNNLRISFPQKGENEILAIEKKFYAFLCDQFVETIKLCSITEKGINKRMAFEGLPEMVSELENENKNFAFLYMGHYGNWEWMSSYSLWMPREFDFFTLYKPLHNAVADKMMIRLRSRFGAKPVPKNDILRRIVENKRNGRLFLAGFIGDQTPNRANLNFWMEFLNQDTPILVGTEKIARKFGLPVISLKMRKVRRGYYEVDFVDVCSDPGQLEPGELTRIHTRLLERYIREVPELWLWSHKRWKLTREDLKKQHE